MAGIYLHIPFCKQACSYCNFHFSTSLGRKDMLLAALKKELGTRTEELKNQTVFTIYFGGGTPSLLSAPEIMDILDAIHKHYQVASEIELTLEANPDDLSEDYLKALRNETPVNRLSIGLQSFVAEDLKFMNRAHNAREGRTCLDLAHKMGFTDLSVDLIYGTPSLSDAAWRQNLATIFEYKIPHLSCYALTVEEKTALAYQVKKKIATAPSEEAAARHFEILLEETSRHGYEQYEISNFCIPPHYARHNTSYWKGENYLGVGPSAHSFDGKSRRWNVANNNLYIQSLQDNAPYWEQETLSPKDIFNEYMLTAFRTKWGVEKQKLQQLQPSEIAHFNENVQKHLAQNLIIETADNFKLSDAGKLLGDYIISDLFM